jgi:hypothetical protein
MGSKVKKDQNIPNFMQKKRKIRTNMTDFSSTLYMPPKYVFPLVPY